MIRDHHVGTYQDIVGDVDAVDCCDDQWAGGPDVASDANLSDRAVYPKPKIAIAPKRRCDLQPLKIAT
jgi:hypothetical protein